MTSPTTCSVCLSVLNVNGDPLRRVAFVRGGVMSTNVEYEKFFPIVPLVGGAIAVSFDVGYFNGASIDYFTMFSLTEHICFALEALPFGLVVGILCMYCDAIVDYSLSFSKEAEGDLETRSAAELRREIKRLTRSIWRRRIVSFIAAVLFAAYLWHLGWFRVLALCVIIYGFMMIRRLKSQRWYMATELMLFVVVSVGAFLFGEFSASNYIRRTPAYDKITLKEGDPITGSVIRAGERGVFYAVPEQGTVAFLQWDNIRSLSRSRPSS